LLKLDSTLGATLEPLDARAARVLGGRTRVHRRTSSRRRG
jgi:hypothetical protein